MGPKIDRNPFVEIQTDQKVSRKYHFFALKVYPGAHGDFWMHLGRPLVPIGSPLAPFCFLLAAVCSFLAPVASFLAPVCSLFVALAHFWHPFVSMLLFFGPPTVKIVQKCWAPEAARHLRFRVG